MEGELQRRVGKNLRAYRKAQGLSQEGLAEKLKIDRTYVGGIERGERNLTLKSLERNAVTLDLEGKSTGALTNNLVSDAEMDAGSIITAFDSRQPPNRESIKLMQS